MTGTTRISGLFATSDDAARAVFGLETLGVDRSAITLVAKENVARHFLSTIGTDTHRGDTPSDQASLVVDDDAQQVRVLVTSLAATVAALVASGVAIVSTGGATIPALAAALAAGTSVGGLAELLERHVSPDLAHVASMEVRGGKLLLTVRVAAPKTDAAEQVMTAAGGSNVHVLDRALAPARS